MEQWLKDALNELGIKHGRIGPEFLEKAKALIERAEIKAARRLEEWKARHKWALEFPIGKQERLLEMSEKVEAAKQKNYIPFLRYQGRTKEELAHSLKHILFDIAQGAERKPPVHYENRLADIIKVALIQDYLEALIIGGMPITGATFPKCTAEELKRDISELCPACPLPELIREGIQRQIIAQAEALQAALPPAQFKAYLSREITAAADAMAELMQHAQRPGAVFGNITRAFIWNKERIKALQAFSEPRPLAAFGEELATVVRAALKERGLLDKAGKFTGETSPHIKALFCVLRTEQRPYLRKTSKIQAARILAALFASEFGKEFEPRTISTAESQKSQGQEKAETDFLKVIPPRK